MVICNHIRAKINNKIIVAHNNIGGQLMNTVNNALVLRITELLKKNKITQDNKISNQNKT